LRAERYLAGSSMLQAVLADYAMKVGLATEMQEQPDFEIRRTEIAEELKICRGMEMLGRLDLDDDLLVNDDVQRLSRERFAAIVHHHGDLAVYAMALGNEITLEGQRVDELPVPKPELAMHVAKGIEDRARYCSVEERCPVGIHSTTLAVCHFDTVTKLLPKPSNGRSSPEQDLPPRGCYFGPLVPVYESLERRYR
jgi:hypothetical protein